MEIPLLDVLIKYARKLKYVNLIVQIQLAKSLANFNPVLLILQMHIAHYHSHSNSTILQAKFPPTEQLFLKKWNKSLFIFKKKTEESLDQMELI